jgi:hypothetical protein
MAMVKFISLPIIAGAVLLAPIVPASSFDYDSYKPSSLEAIGDITEEGASEHEGGFEFYIEKLRVRVQMTDYPLEMNKRELKVLELYFKIFSSTFNPEHLKLFTHQLDLKDSGYDFTFLFQDSLVPYLKKEAKPGDYVLLYVVFGIYDLFERKTILLVNEFSVENRNFSAFGQMGSYLAFTHRFDKWANEFKAWGPIVINLYLDGLLVSKHVDERHQCTLAEIGHSTIKVR